MGDERPVKEIVIGEKASSTKMFWSAVGVIAVLIIIGGCVSIFSDPSPATSKSTTNSLLPEYVDIGKTGVLSNNDGTPVFAATSTPAFMGMLKAFNARDEVGLKELISIGIVGAIESGTKVLVLERDWDAEVGTFGVPTRVRVLDGPLAEEAYWVENDKIKSTT